MILYEQSEARFKKIKLMHFKIHQNFEIKKSEKDGNEL